MSESNNKEIKRERKKKEKGRSERTNEGERKVREIKMQIQRKKET